MDKGVWEAARSVRPYLRTMLRPSVAAEVDAQLAELLTATREVDDQELRAVLEQWVETSEFLEQVLDDAPYFRPPQAVSATVVGRGYSGLPGAPSPVGADKYSCPKGDCVWYLPDVGVEVVCCPTHQIPLEPVSGG